MSVESLGQQTPLGWALWSNHAEKLPRVYKHRAAVIIDENTGKLVKDKRKLEPGREATDFELDEANRSKMFLQNVKNPWLEFMRKMARGSQDD